MPESSPPQCNSTETRRRPLRARTRPAHRGDPAELDLDWDDISAAKDAGGNPASAERRVPNAVIYGQEPPIARIILNRPDRPTPGRPTGRGGRRLFARLTGTARSGVVILKAKRQGILRRAMWPAGVPTRIRTPTSATPSRTSTGHRRPVPVADAVSVGVPQSRPSPAIHGYCMGGGIYLDLLPISAWPPGRPVPDARWRRAWANPAGTHDRAWLLMNWHRTMDWLLLAPTLSAQEAPGLGTAEQGGAAGRISSRRSGHGQRIAQIP